MRGRAGKAACLPASKWHGGTCRPGLGWTCSWLIPHRGLGLKHARPAPEACRGKSGRRDSCKPPFPTPRCSCERERGSKERRTQSPPRTRMRTLRCLKWRDEGHDCRDGRVRLPQDSNHPTGADPDIRGTPEYYHHYDNTRNNRHRDRSLRGDFHKSLVRVCSE